MELDTESIIGLTLVGVALIGFAGLAILLVWKS